MVVLVPNYNVEWLVSVHQTVRVDYVTVFCTHRTLLFPILTFDIMLRLKPAKDCVLQLTCRILPPWQWMALYGIYGYVDD